VLTNSDPVGFDARAADDELEAQVAGCEEVDD